MMQKLVWNSEPSKNLWCIFSSLIFQIVWLYVVHILKEKREAANDDILKLLGSAESDLIWPQSSIPE